MRVRAALLTAGIAAVGAAACGVVSLPGSRTGSHARTSSHAPTSSAAGLAAQREAADRQWATATCANILAWKNEIRRDGTSLNPGLGPLARIKQSITATDRLLDTMDKLGAPPTARNAQARIETEQLRSNIESRLNSLEHAAGSVASGNILAIGTLVSELAHDKVLGSQIASELRRVVSVDLGVSLAETRMCRQLVGVPI